MESKKIVILDDDMRFSNMLRERLEKYFKERITVFSKYNKEIFATMKIDLLFLDIEMDIINGIHVAKEIIRFKNKPIIIFVSNNDGMIHNTLEVRPLYFIRKTFFEEDLNRAFALLENINFYNVNVIQVANEELLIKDILYIESADHRVTIHLKDSNLECRMTLLVLEEQLLEHCFVRAHRSYIINLRQIQYHNSSKIHLRNGEQIDIGRRYYGAFKKAYKEAKLDGII